MAEFRSLFGMYYSRVFAYLYGATLDFEYARELTLVVFLKAIEEGATQTNPLRVFEIARESVLDRWVASAQIAEGGDDLDSGSRAVLSALRQLRAKDREVLSLRFDAGLSDAEIASIIETSEDDVKVAVSRALQELRSELVPEHQEI